MQTTALFYPSTDGEPVAETFVHLWAMVVTLAVLRSYLKTRAQEQHLSPEQEGTVLANQFLYYRQGRPEKRIAPDVMIIPHVPAGGRDHYKIWEEGQIPSVIFEMTSKSTQDKDQNEKKTLYEQLGVPEYWLFDPRGEWIVEQLRGYRWEQGTYRLIQDRRSVVLGLRLVVEGEVLGFYREDTGLKLLAPDELLSALLQEQNETSIQRQRAEQAELRADRLAARLKALGIDPDQI